MNPPREETLPALPDSLYIPHVLLLIDTAGAVGRGIVEGIGRYATENGPWSIQYEYRALDSLPPIWLEKWRGDGIITRTIYAKQTKLIQATQVPYVEVLGDPEFAMAQVWTDYYIDGQKAVEHFLDHGLRHFAYFTYGKAWGIEEHREALCKNLKERGYDCHIYRAPNFKRNLPVWDDRQLPGVMKWLRALPRPIGVITFSDLHAVRLLDICRQLHIAVPEEMAILGRGNDPVICETVRPTLSSMDLDARRFGYEAARLLDWKMTGKPVPDKIVVPPSHVAVRQSTDHMAIPDADVIQAMQFIRDTSCKGIKVAHVAEVVGVSRRGLERRFQRYLGTTPKEVILRIRLECAKNLLGQTDNAIEKIAHRCGFASLAYFSRAFRREVGMTANAYRKMRRVSRD
jgi:LacI family transcriptional regulator